MLQENICQTKVIENISSGNLKESNMDNGTNNIKNNNNSGN